MRLKPNRWYRSEFAKLTINPALNPKTYTATKFSGENVYIKKKGGITKKFGLSKKLNEW